MKDQFGPLARRQERWFYLLAAPWLVGLLLLQAGPLLGGLGIALFDWPLPRPPQFVGTANIEHLLNDPLVGKSLLNTILYALGSVPAGLAASLALALLLDGRGIGISLFRSLFFLPSVISSVATVLVWGWIFHPRFGAINAALGTLGISGPEWLASPRWAMPTLILMSLTNIGANIIIYLAGLQAIPQELKEAAALDGAGPWRTFRHVTLPLISPITLFLLVSNSIAAFQVFTPSYLLTQGGPDNATLTLPLYIFFNAFRWSKLGYASALSALLLVIVAGLAALQFLSARRWVFYLGGDS